ncbi:MAG: hypothetical protein ISS33_06700 [Candidatus Omnitrophica bacterium]|nr:hypothetical protein [Candidatus Omnitrophota bacterium]
MKPRKNYRSRPKKDGAKKRQKVLAQKRRLVAAGCDKESLEKLSTVEIRDLLKKTARKKPGKSGAKPVKAGKPAKKKAVIKKK